ncbi:MAG: hypothetical protein KME16_15095 [Scytolyngbya sp. HA4215-MV1]|jgi:hypothetical protein|nr:hypothetical protein [Scytolyngbya sp. HA4215-MV1]
MARKQQGGFGLPQWSETTKMTDLSSPIQINPDPRILTLLVIGTEDNVKAYILRQHTLGVTEAGAWSKPIPVPSCPDKVLCVFNRITV